MIIPMWVDGNKDVVLVKWLKSQTNTSAFMRFVLYEKMNEIQGNIEKNQGNVVNLKEKVDKIDDDFMNSIENL